MEIKSRLIREKDTRKKLSVIIPVYRGEKTINSNLIRFKNQMRSLRSKYIGRWEIIVIVDGSLADRTYEEAKRVKGVSVYQYYQNQGKGYALMYGVKKSIGDYIIFLDADGDFEIKQIRNFLPYLSSADVVVGSKRHPFSKIEYPWFRRLLSRIFQFISKIILDINLRDTQSGFKVIKREVLDTLGDLTVIRKFAFDLELCFLAQKYGFRVVEAPINIKFQGRSTISFKHAFAMLFDVFRIRFFFSFKKVYQSKFYQQNFKD